MTEEDPALTENIDNLFARNDAKPLPGTGKWKPSEHTKASLSIRNALEKLPGWKRIRKRNTARYVLADTLGNPIKRYGKWVHVYIGVKGDPDIEVSYSPPSHNGDPYSIAIEVKTGTGRLTEEQIEKRDHLTAGGWRFIVAGTAAEAFEQIMAIVRR